MAEESSRDTGTDIRRKAAIRLGIAAVVTLLALAGLWWLDSSGKEKPKPKSTAPAPIVSAPAPTPPTPPEPAEPEPTPTEPTTSPEAAPPPPPPPVAESAASRQERPAVTPRPTAPRTQDDHRRVSPVTAPTQTPTSEIGPFVVQLGVFGNPANAQEMVERLKKQGIQAYTETRVQVGPFRSKAEAEKARAELRRIGITGLVGTTK